MTLRIGVVGTGVMGAEHARILAAAVGGAEVSAIADLNLARAHNVAARVGAEVFRDPFGLIGSDSVDAVVIASHDSSHYEHVSACLRHRKPVLCEKPLAPTLDECSELVESQDRLALPQELISVGLMRRFHPPLVALKQEIDAESLGAPLLVLGSHRNVSSYPAGGSEGTLTNSAVHDIDTVAWLLGSSVAEVSWHAPKATTFDTSRHDPQLIHLRTESGVLASVDLFLNANYGYEVRFEVVCEVGAVQTRQATKLHLDKGLWAGYTHPPDWREFFADAYRLELQAWVQAIHAGRPTPLATARDGLHTIAVAEALIASMRQGGVTVAVS